jgi:hypothetical protein
MKLYKKGFDVTVAQLVAIVIAAIIIIIGLVLIFQGSGALSNVFNRI